MKEDTLWEGKLSVKQLANNLEISKEDSASEIDIETKRMLIGILLSDFPKIRLLNTDDLENEYSIKLVNDYDFSITPKFKLEGIILDNEFSMRAAAYRCTFHDDRVYLEQYSSKGNLTIYTKPKN